MILILAALACIGGDEAKDSGSVDDTDSTAACETLEPSACGARADCTALNGRELTIPDTGGAACYDLGSAEPLACLTGEVTCGAAITFATQPDGHGPCYYFTNTCVPEGWVSCEPDYNAWDECGT